MMQQICDLLTTANFATTVKKDDLHANVKIRCFFVFNKQIRHVISVSWALFNSTKKDVCCCSFIRFQCQCKSVTLFTMQSCIL